MDNFISRDEIIRKRHGCKKNCASCDFVIDGDSWCQGELFVIDVLRAPAADVRPVVRGKWTMNSDRPDTLICTACDHAFDVWVWDHKWMHFCPNCGADMREEHIHE